MFRGKDMKKGPPKPSSMKKQETKAKHLILLFFYTYQQV